VNGMKNPHAQSDVLCLKRNSCCVAVNEVSELINAVTKIAYRLKSSLMSNSWLLQELEIMKNIVINVRSSLDFFTRNFYRVDDKGIDQNSLAYTATNILNRLVEFRNRLIRVMEHIAEKTSEKETENELLNVFRKTNAITMKLIIIFLAFATKIEWSKDLAGPFSASMASATLATLLNIDNQVVESIKECVYS